MSYEIVELLDRINENGTTIIMVTHEHELVKQFDHRIVVIDNGEVVSDMANGGVLHYDSKTGYQPVPNVTEMKTITLHNISFQNSPVTQVIEQEAPAADPAPVEVEEPTLSFAEATLKEIELDIEAKRGGDSNG
jgi:ABC-type methionine transport system ATPase subunit